MSKRIKSPGSVLDHSTTYRLSLRTFPHLLRKRAILKQVRHIKATTYADFGCSNGYITNAVARAIGAQTVHAYDHETRHFDKGKANYAEIDFRQIDLNQSSKLGPYDLVTCFETLEHVGNLKNAVETVRRAGQTVIISVPIEIGFVGIIKFLAKVIIFRYQTLGGFWPYFKTLLTNGDIGRFRDERTGWGTHFGFDYRELDRLIGPCRKFNSGTSRFYILES